MAPGYTIAIDVMGGDCGPHVTLPAASEFLTAHPEHRLLLVGDRRRIVPFLNRTPNLAARTEILHAERVVARNERPSAALRHGQDSSLYQTIEAVARGEAQACISAGNTGALMAIGRHLLGTFSGIDRPAIASPIPTLGGHFHMLDLGANVDCSAEQLYQFALMGSALAAALDGCQSPRVALLNNGTEKIKGTEQVRQAAALMEAESALNYIGYLEGDELYSARADIVVCDGFVGNVVLKSMEGVARLLSDALGQTFRGSLRARLAGLLVRGQLRGLEHQLDPAHRNGASLIGLQGIVIKSHGGTDRAGFVSALEQALAEVTKQVPDAIARKLAKIHAPAP